MSEIKSPIDLNEVSGYNASEAKKTPKDTSKLDHDAFMKLFLEQLKNQDPTAPMETDKIITQTAQLTQVEMQEQAKQTMIEVAKAMKSSQETNEELKNFQSDMKATLENLAQFLGGENALSNINLSQDSNALNAIGKIAETAINGLNLEENQPISFDLYFDEPIENTPNPPKILIYNNKKELVKTLDLSHKIAQSGYLNFTWDGKNDNGENLPSGAYNIIAQYNFKPNGEYNLARIGRGEVQSIIISDNKPHLRMGELIVPFNEAIEFYSKNGGK